jgi:hypothetical protein
MLLSKEYFIYSFIFKDFSNRVVSCIQLIMEWMSDAFAFWSWFSLLQMAALYNTPNLKKFCLNFIIKPENFDKVIKTEAFTKLDKELILEVLRSRPSTPPSPKPLIRRPQSSGSNISCNISNTNNTNTWLLSFIIEGIIIVVEEKTFQFFCNEQRSQRVVYVGSEWVRERDCREERRSVLFHIRQESSTKCF